MSWVSEADCFLFSLIPSVQVSGLNETKTHTSLRLPWLTYTFLLLQATSKLLLFLQTAKRLLHVFDAESAEQDKNRSLLSFELSASETRRRRRNILFQLRVSLREVTHCALQHLLLVSTLVPAQPAIFYGTYSQAHHLPQKWQPTRKCHTEGCGYKKAVQCSSQMQQAP